MMFVRIYALAVCFSAILCITITTGIGIFDALQMTLPELTMPSWERQRTEYPVAYPATGMPREARLLNESGAPIKREALSEEEVQQARERQWAVSIDNTRHDARRSLIQVLIILMLAIPLFVIHWRLAKRLDEKSDSLDST